MASDPMKGCKLVITRVVGSPTTRKRREALAPLRALIGSALDVASLWWQGGRVVDVTVRLPGGTGVSTLFEDDVEGWIVYPCGHKERFPEVLGDPADTAANAKDLEAWDK